MNRSYIRNNVTCTWLLLLIVMLALISRIIQAHLGLPYVYNFDDPQIGGVALHILKTGDLDPHFFAYGSFIIYLDAVVDAANYLRLAALPIGTPESLLGLDQVKQLDTVAAQFWTITHPSFYLWNRYLTAVFGTLTVIITYHIARFFVADRWALVPALLLAIMPVHIFHSGLLTPDVPVGFMVGASTLAALQFQRDGRVVPLATSLVFVGLAAATKYNSALIWICPALALILTRDRRWWHWLLLVAVPTITFLCVTPYALLDFKTFITQLAVTVSSYHAPGPHSVRPGIRHFILALAQFRENLGTIVAIAAIVGLVTLLASMRRKVDIILIIVFPIAFLAYMSTTVRDYHRNFMPLYPFLCLYAGYGLFTVYRVCVRFAASRDWGRTEGAAVIASILVLLVVLQPLRATVINAVYVANHQDTRTRMIDYANSSGTTVRLEILGDLHFHQFDLSRLKIPYKEVPLEQILNDVCANENDETQAFILPAKLFYYGLLPATQEQLAAIDHDNAILHALRSAPGVVDIGGDSPLLSWGPSIDPGLLLVSAPSAADCR